MMTGLESCHRKTFNVKFFSLSSKATFTQYQSNFRPVEKLDQTLCHMKLFQILALFTWNCRTAIFPSKMSNSITCKPMLAIYVCNFPLFSLNPTE